MSVPYLPPDHIDPDPAHPDVFSPPCVSGSALLPNGDAPRLRPQPPIQQNTKANVWGSNFGTYYPSEFCSDSYYVWTNLLSSGSSIRGYVGVRATPIQSSAFDHQSRRLWPPRRRCSASFGGAKLMRYRGATAQWDGCCWSGGTRRASTPRPGVTPSGHCTDLLQRRLARPGQG